MSTKTPINKTPLKYSPWNKEPKVITPVGPLIVDPATQGRVISLGRASELAKILRLQRSPRYTKAKEPTGWKTIHRTLSDWEVLGHIQGWWRIGALGPYYPKYGILDIDVGGLELVQEIQEELGLTIQNSIICASTTPGHFHLIIKPEYRNEPMTLKLYQTIMRRYGRSHHVEAFPHHNKTCQIPLIGPHQILVGKHIEQITAEERVRLFESLLPFDLSGMPWDTIPRLIGYKGERAELSGTQTAEGLLEYGLQGPSTRHEAQFLLLQYYFRNNVDPRQAQTLVLEWLRENHNGFSKTVNAGRWREIRAEIGRQTKSVYSYYEERKVFPDSTDASAFGAITKEDLIEIIKITKGNYPRAKLLFHIVKYIYPRKYQNEGAVGIPRELLIGWSSWKTYEKYLREFEKQGILERSKAYIWGEAPKTIKLLRWKFKDEKEAIYFKGRSIKNYDGAIRTAFEFGEFRNLLRSAGALRTTALMQANKIWQGDSSMVLDEEKTVGQMLVVVK